MNAPPYSPGAAPRKRGCFFYGCLTVVILGLLAGAVVGITGYFAVKKLNQVLADYTSTAPVELPQVEMSDAEYAVLDQRVKAFGAALEGGEGVEPLTLTADELNVLLNRNQAVQEGKGGLHVVMTGNEISGQVSLLLDPLARGPMLSRLRGRYFNATVRLGVGTQNGSVVVRLLGAKVQDKTMPAELVRALETYNLMDHFYMNPQSNRFLNKIDSVEVIEGRLVVTPVKNRVE